MKATVQSNYDAIRETSVYNFSTITHDNDASYTTGGLMIFIVYLYDIMIDERFILEIYLNTNLQQ